MKKDYVLEVKTSEIERADLIYQEKPAASGELSGPENKSPKYVRFTVRPAVRESKTGFLVLRLMMTMGAIFALYIAIFETLSARTQAYVYLERVLRGRGWNERVLQIGIFFACYHLVNMAHVWIYSQAEECVTIIPNLGVQSESSVVRKGIFDLVMEIGVSLTHHSKRHPAVCKQIVNKQFFPMETVEDIAIVEGFKNFQVIFYLSLVVADPNGTGNLQMFVLFPKLLPRRKLLETVWQRSRVYLNKQS